MAFILFFKSDISSVGGTGKWVYESKSGNIYYENCGQDGWKFDSGEMNPSVKSWNYFENYGHKIGGMGHIESNNSNPAYMIGSCCTYSGWSCPSQIRSGWNMDSY